MKYTTLISALNTIYRYNFLEKNEFTCGKLYVILTFCNEKVPFIDFLSKI